MDVAGALKGNLCLIFIVSAGDIADDRDLAQSLCSNPIVPLLPHCRFELKAEP